MQRRVCLIAVLFAALAGCARHPEPASPTGSEARASRVASEAMKCDPAAALHPFVVTWDASDQAELAAQAQQSLVLVRLSGCRLELQPSCQVPGEYRVHETSGNLVSVSIESQDRLAGQLPIGGASLSAELARSGGLDLRYFARAVRQATAPMLYRSQLGRECKSATHLVVNWVSGAYELSEKGASSIGGGAQALGASASADKKATHSVLFRGGDLAACATSSRGCTAPVRLRLVPIEDGAPGDDYAAAAARSITRPAEGKNESLTRETISAAVRGGFGALKSCYESQLERKGSLTGTVQAHFTVAPDGTVAELRLVTQDAFDPGFLQCAEDIFRSVRFPSAGGKTTVVYPVIFSP